MVHYTYKHIPTCAPRFGEYFSPLRCAAHTVLKAPAAAAAMVCRGVCVAWKWKVIVSVGVIMWSRRGLESDIWMIEQDQSNICN